MEELVALSSACRAVIKTDADNWIAIRHGDRYALFCRLYFMLIACLVGAMLIVLVAQPRTQELIPTPELVARLSVASQLCEQVRLWKNGSVECLRLKPNYRWLLTNGTKP